MPYRAVFMVNGLVSVSHIRIEEHGGLLFFVSFRVRGGGAVLCGAVRLRMASSNLFLSPLLACPNN